MNTFPSSETGCHQPDQFLPAKTPVPPDIFHVPRSCPGSSTHSSLQLSPSFVFLAQTPTKRVLPSGVVIPYPPHLPAALLAEFSLVVMLVDTKTAIVWPFETSIVSADIATLFT